MNDLSKRNFLKYVAGGATTRRTIRRRVALD
jgi:hypothetical protein